MRAKNKKLLVACCAVACGSLFVGGYAANNTVANADATSTATPIAKATATVDGVIDEAYLTSYKVEAATADLIKVAGTDLTGQSISYYALHDDDNLYVAAKITTAENAWDGTTTDETTWAWKATDAAELRVKFANDDTQYGFFGDYQAKFKSTTGDYEGGYDYKASVVNDTTYIVEFKVPFTDANKGQNLQITVQADDYGMSGHVGAYAKKIGTLSGSDSRMPVNADVLSVDVAPVVPDTTGPVEIKEGVDATTGQKWEGNYGADGYVVMGAAGIYSDMYTDNNVDATTLHTGGKMSTYRYWWNNTTDSKDQTYGLNESAPISQWGAVNAGVMSNTGLKDYTLYAPGTKTTTETRFHNTWDTPFRELSLWFKLDTDEEIYFTVNVGDWNKKVSSTDKIAADLYKRTSDYKGAYMKTDTVDTFNNFYGEGNAPIATQLVEAQTTYVTYKIQGAGFYQLVLHDAVVLTADTYTNNMNTTIPQINGFFFDYATEKSSYTITYNGIGADSGITMPDKYVTEYKAGVDATLPTPTKLHTTFDGWYTAETGGDKVTSLASMSGNLSLWPRFTYVEWDATYDFGSYTGKVYLDEAKTQELTATKFNYYEAFTLPATLYLEGDYEFKGWYEDEDYEYETTGFDAGTVSADWTFYAKIEAKAVLPVVSAITYHNVEGATNPNPATYTEGTALTLQSATKEGYTFDGWYTDSACTNKVTKISAQSTGAVQLYAKFTENVVTPPETSSPDTTEPDTSEPETSTSDTTETKKDGCGSSVAGVGVVGAVMAVVAAVVACRKRKDD